MYMENTNVYLDNIFKGIDDNVKLDYNQKQIILDQSKACLVIAGAGAGKTTTMSAKVKYLCYIKGVKPEEILLISYTNKAVEELKTRINKEFNIPCKISTFHSLGLEIVTKNTTKKTIVEDDYNLLKLVCKNNEIKTMLADYLLYYEYDNYIGNTKKDYLRYCATKKYVNFKGEVVENQSEVTFTNLLFLNDINYQYKKSYVKNKKNYTPTVTINFNNTSIYVNIMSFDNKYIKKKSIDKISVDYKKRFPQNYFEIGSGKNEVSQFVNIMSDYNILFKNHSSNFYEKIPTFKKEKVFKLISQYSGLIKNKGLDIEKLLEKKLNNRQRVFLQIIKIIDKTYTEYLTENNMIDFNMMISQANDLLSKQSNILLNYKYIIIDEYQDIARQRFNLIYKLVTLLDFNLIVVGDDWQGIFSFCGSEIDLFIKFKEIFKGCMEYKIINTYRNSQKLINIAGKFVQKNSYQIKKKLISNKYCSKPIIIKWYTTNKNIVLEKVIDSIIKEYTVEKNILIILRFNFEINYILKDKNFILEHGKLIYKNYPMVHIEYMSAHSSKGLGFDNVIIYNADDGIYGFPSKIIDDSLYHLLKTSKEVINYPEERRLFYVALTRTKNKTYIISSKYRPSSFIMELSNYFSVKKDFIPQTYKSDIYCPKCGFILKKVVNSKEKIFQCTNHYLICGYEKKEINY